MRATSDLWTDLSDNATWHDQVKLNKNNNVEERSVARPCEILFVDASVSDIDTILGGLRPGVEAKVLELGHSGGPADRGGTCGPARS